MEEFICPVRIFSGPGSLGALETFGARRLFVVTDTALFKSGAAKAAAARARCREAAYFPVGPKPTVETAAQGAGKLRAFHPDLVAAIGTGDTLDCAKAMAYFSKVDCPLAAVPGLPGPGSEVTPFSTLLHEGAARTIRQDGLRPAAAILDGDMLREQSGQAMAQGGFLVLSHALEAYVARGGGTLSGIFAREAFSAAYGALPAACAGKDRARGRLLEASAMAGAAYAQAGLGMCQAIIESLGRFFPLSPGILAAILLPSVLSINAQVVGGQYGSLARSAGMGGSTQSTALGNLRNALGRLRRELELPETLAQAGVDPRAVWSNTGAIVSAAMDSPHSQKNPLEPEDFLIRRVLEEVTGRV